MEKGAQPTFSQQRILSKAVLQSVGAQQQELYLRKNVYTTYDKYIKTSFSPSWTGSFFDVGMFSKFNSPTLTSDPKTIFFFKIFLDMSSQEHVREV